MADWFVFIFSEVLDYRPTLEILMLGSINGTERGAGSDEYDVNLSVCHNPNFEFATKTQLGTGTSICGELHLYSLSFERSSKLKMTLQFSEPISGKNTSDSSHQLSVAQPHLATQDASTVNPSKLTALSPEVVSDLVCL